jgi:hypothetical protein
MPLILDPQVAGGAGADAAAGVIEKDAEVLRHVEKRHRLAVMLVGHGAELELDRLAFGLKGDADELVGGNVFLFASLIQFRAGVSLCSPTAPCLTNCADLTVNWFHPGLFSSYSAATPLT